MSSREPKSEWITLAASPTDKLSLEAIRAIAGDDTLSATVRRLIRQEARRLGVTVQVTAADADPEAVPA